MSNNLILKENIHTKIYAENFEDLVGILVNTLVNQGDVTATFYENVLKREESFPTGLPTEPYGVAIPHTDAIHVKKNRIAIATLKQPIKMNVMGGTSDDFVEVSIVFLLALGESNKQLNILQNLMQVLPNQEALEKIYQGNEDEIFNYVVNELKL